MVDVEPIQTEILTVDPRELVLLERNARFMRAQTFARLVENIRRDGRLTSTPFCVREGDRLKVLSGNHRVMAAIEAGLEEIDVMVAVQDLPPDRQRAIQLAHNAIEGEDDPWTLRELYEEITDIALKAYTGLDDRELEAMVKAATLPLTTEKLEMATITLVFTPTDAEELVQALTALADRVRGEAWAAPFELYDRMLDGLDTAALSFDIKSRGVAFAALLRFLRASLPTLQVEAERAGGDYPLPVLFQRLEVPRSEAQAVKRALDRVGGDPWEALLQLLDSPSKSKSKRDG